MHLSRTTLYAINATLQLAKLPQGATLTCKALAEHGRMPVRFLLTVLRRLIGTGIIRSVRGSGGGYCVNRPLDQITLLDVVDTFDQHLIEPTRPDLFTDCPLARESLIVALDGASGAMRDRLRAVTLAELTHSPASFESDDAIGAASSLTSADI